MQHLQGQAPTTSYNPHSLVEALSACAVGVNHTINAALKNARAVVNKSGLLREIIADNDINLMAITETWLQVGDDPAIIFRPLPTKLQVSWSTPPH